ncbi:ABC transporter ATP-binding protein [Aurantibacillus circumpalustris]|uniref:ABC transporter ATP-binding protein n=1 Tax=Aurantibacillus circumpalustris TaxID=3036359 RepID=UPI00295B8477|nr:ABC transporter ATP-binding protein [Aurantibacillus circumpalustris]
MSGDTIIKVEGLSKKYLLNKNNSPKSDTLYSALFNTFKNVRNVSKKGNKEDFWALQDISFEIEKGDRVGIIGRNGAGKSTLLKILSRITPPTAGKIEYSGRMASLLEVGTGFHGDLSGRENIYLNGSILGMTKQEIDKKFDEIVDFSEVEKFIDTPVKRYSSGMYVRLAFAVAANLEPDILIVDEVLAVGDAQFQRKCLGKMEDVSTKEGRTILFVSHNMGAVQNLCNKGLFLQEGKAINYSDISTVIKQYLDFGNTVSNSVFTFEDQENYKTSKAYFTKVELKNKNSEHTSDYPVGDAINFHIQFESSIKLDGTVVGLGILSATELPILTTWSKPENFKEGMNEIIFTFDDIFLAPGYYKIAIGISRGNEVLDYNTSTVFFNISDIINIPNADRLVNTNSGVLMNQLTYKIS